MDIKLLVINFLIFILLIFLIYNYININKIKY